MRRQNANLYKSQLSKIKNIKTPIIPNNFFHVFQKYTIQVENKERDNLKKHLTDK